PPPPARSRYVVSPTLSRCTTAVSTASLSAGLLTAPLSFPSARAARGGKPADLDPFPHVDRHVAEPERRRVPLPALWKEETFLIGPGVDWRAKHRERQPPRERLRQTRDPVAALPLAPIPSPGSAPLPA